MELNPAIAARTLIENSQKLDKIADAVIAQRNEMLGCEVIYLNKKASVSRKFLSEMSATAAQHWIGIETTEEKIELLKAEAELKNIQDSREVLIESNNNLKMAIKLWDTEVKNLNLN